MEISFHQLAERELNDAADYYRQQQPSLGSAFVTEIQRCTKAILQNPEAGPIILGPVRRRICRRFPYAVLYTVRGQTVRVLAVMNLKRRPAYWIGRA